MPPVLPASDPDARAAVRARLLGAQAVATHDDADGLSAGALLLRARGEPASAAWLPEPHQTPWAREGLPDGDLAILDLGIRSLDGPAVILDHHVPEAEPAEGQLAMTGHGEEPETSTSALVARVLGPGEGGGIPWLAALGAFGDLGSPGLDLPEAAGARRTAIRKLTPLVNAPRRVRGGPVRTALALLVEHEDAAAALADPRIAELEASRVTWRASFDRAVRTAPRMGDAVAVVLFDEPCQVHPLVATTWERRLGPRPVIAANAGWLDGRINFAIRGGPEDGDLRALLHEALPEARSGEFGHGHPRATGGSLEPDRFALLLERLGVPLA